MTDLVTTHSPTPATWRRCSQRSLQSSRKRAKRRTPPSPEPGVGDDPSSSEAKARKFLQRRLVEIAAGKFTPRQDKLTVEEVLDAFLARYRMEGRRSLRSTTFVLAHVRCIFRGYRAIEVSGPKLRNYGRI
jgi:hypothetical protein